MKKLCLLLVALLLVLTSCFKVNETLEYNKKVLDENYEFNPNYAVIAGETYQTSNQTIDFGKLIDRKLNSDGKYVEWLYSRKPVITLVGDKIYFCYEYNRNDDLGKYAIGYVDLTTESVYADYFEYQRWLFTYVFSTNNFVVYKFSKYGSNQETNFVFFKDENKVSIWHDLANLKYSEADVEETQGKDYYFENGIKYTLVSDNATNLTTGEVIKLPTGNELKDKVSILKEMYEQFSYEVTSINAIYISNGEELFFYISDRPTNHSNTPFILFKCNLDLTDVTYIGHYNYRVYNVINLNN